MSPGAVMSLLCLRQCLSSLPDGDYVSQARWGRPEAGRFLLDSLSVPSMVAGMPSGLTVCGKGHGGHTPGGVSVWGWTRRYPHRAPSTRRVTEQRPYVRK